MTDLPICEVCSNKPATLVITRRRQDCLDRTFVCPDCAGERVRVLGGTGINFEQIIAGVNGKPTSSDKASFSCALCGTTLADIIVEGKPGCCLCYSRFQGEIEEALHKLQRSKTHFGKAPTR